MIAYSDDDDNNNNIHLYSAFLLVIQSALQSVLMVINLIKYYNDLFVKKMNKIIIIIINKIKLQLKSTLKKKCFCIFVISFLNPDFVSKLHTLKKNNCFENQ